MVKSEGISQQLVDLLHYWSLVTITLEIITSRNVEYSKLENVRCRERSKRKETSCLRVARSLSRLRKEDRRTGWWISLSLHRVVSRCECVEQFYRRVECDSWRRLLLQSCSSYHLHRSFLFSFLSSCHRMVKEEELKLKVKRDTWNNRDGMSFCFHKLITFFLLLFFRLNKGFGLLFRWEARTFSLRQLRSSHSREQWHMSHFERFLLVSTW